MTTEKDPLRKTLCGRVTKQQKVLLLENMKANVDVGRGKFTANSSSKQRKLCWKHVALELNSVRGGKKSPQQWKRCWIDWKAAVKKHYTQVREFSNKPGNFPPSDGPKPLDDLEKQIIQFFSESIVEVVCVGFPEQVPELPKANSSKQEEEEPRNILSELKKMNNTMESILTELREIKRKLS